ncbi:MAG: tyrosine-protein phosphatase [Chloroflexi bacterium]|nr:tyrosine-protein phosphatase [Chloroflexota bacterium]
MTAASLRDLESVHNFRELGPYPLAGGGRIRAGMVYRSGALELMTGADCDYLGEELSVATIIDLRHPDEMATEPHALTSRVHHVSLFPDYPTQEALIAELNGLYGAGPSAKRYLHYLHIGGAQIARAFSLFAREDAYPILVHCTAGKDRTGVLLGLLMDVLGADDEDIAAEYGLSDASIGRLIAYLRATGRVLEGTDEELFARLSTPPDRMAGFIQLMRAKYGSAEAYLRSEGIPTEAFSRVREILIERP